MTDLHTNVPAERQHQAEMIRRREAQAALAVGAHYWVAHLIYVMEPPGDDEETELILDLENLRSAPSVSCLICGDDDFSKTNVNCPGL